MGQADVSLQMNLPTHLRTLAVRVEHCLEQVWLRRISLTHLHEASPGCAAKLALGNIYVQIRHLPGSSTLPAQADRKMGKYSLLHRAL